MSKTNQQEKELKEEWLHASDYFRDVRARALVASNAVKEAAEAVDMAKAAVVSAERSLRQRTYTANRLNRAATEASTEMSKSEAVAAGFIVVFIVGFFLGGLATVLLAN